MPTLYSNVSESAISTEELTVTFALRNYVQPTEATGEVKVIMPLIHAKRLVMSLSQLIQNYEAAFGEINVSPVPRVQPSVLKDIGFKG